MGKIKYLISNINVSNILLTGVLLAFAYFAFFSGPPAGVRHRKAVAKRAEADKKPAEAKKVAQDDKNPFPTDYMIIAEQNLFNPARKIPEKKDVKQEAPAEKPDFVLDGTLITDDLKMAFMEDKKAPVNTPGRPNRQTPLKIGDSMSGYTLTEIDKDKVVMQKGEDKMVIALESKEKDKTRKHTTTTVAPPGRQPARVRPASTPRAAVQRATSAPTPAKQQATRNKFLNMFRSMRR